jgi:hypothetical protein
MSANSINIPFDATVARLNSNGAILCIKLPDVSAAPTPRMMRNLQTSDITVAYNIIDANNLFVTDMATFKNAFATDPNMLSYANSVGSTGIRANPPDILSASAPAVAPQQNIGAIAGGIFGGFIVVGILGVAVFTTIKLRNRKSVVLGATKPPVNVSNPLNYAGEQHMAFSPVPCRRSV